MPSSEGTFSVLPEPSPKKRRLALLCGLLLSTSIPQEQSPGLEDSGGTVFFETAVWASDAVSLACRQEAVLSAVAPPPHPPPPLTLWVLGARGAPRAPLVAPFRQELANTTGKLDLCACFTLRRLFLCQTRLPSATIEPPLLLSPQRRQKLWKLSGNCSPFRSSSCA